MRRAPATVHHAALAHPRPIPVGFREFPITMLPARDGVKHSSIAPNCSYSVNWTSEDDSMAWLLHVHTAGRYQVSIGYTGPVPDAGSAVDLSFKDARLAGKVAPIRRFTQTRTRFHVRPRNHR